MKIQNEHLLTEQEKELVIFVRNRFLREARALGMSGRHLRRWAERKLRKWAKVEFKDKGKK